jgi:hypothetical protein
MVERLSWLNRMGRPQARMVQGSGSASKVVGSFLHEPQVDQPPFTRMNADNESRTIRAHPSHPWFNRSRLRARGLGLCVPQVSLVDGPL